MTTADWERRYACALGMAIYIHVTHDSQFLTFFGLGMCMLFASIPAIKEWDDKRRARQQQARET